MSGSSSGATTSASRRRWSTRRPPRRSSAACSACPSSRSRSPAPRCGATTRCTPPTCSRAGCSASATRSTVIRRATGSGPTPPCRTLTTCLGSSRRCCAGRPPPVLLDTYSAERAPVARQIVLRANRSSREFGQFFDALGMTEATTEAEMIEQIEERKANTPRGAAKQAALVKARNKNFDTARQHGSSTSPRRSSPTGPRVPSRTATPSSTISRRPSPGRRLPHVWVGDSTRKLSTLDLAPFTRFTLITGIAGEAWAGAAGEGRA